MLDKDKNGEFVEGALHLLLKHYLLLTAFCLSHTPFLLSLVFSGPQYSSLRG